MTEKRKILVVEDDETVRSGLVDLLTYHGYEVSYAQDGEEGLRLATSRNFDLVILDIGLPRRDGFSICSYVRKRDEEVAIIALTARSNERDIAEGFTLGVDDYIAKPFSIHELMHRVRAVLRRKEWGDGRKEAAKDFKLGSYIQISPLNFQAKLVDNSREVALTKREADILKYLYKNNQRAVSRSELLSQLWQHRPGSVVETRTVDIHIAKLRRKIEPDPAEPRFLITVRAEGYQLISASNVPE